MREGFIRSSIATGENIYQGNYKDTLLSQEVVHGTENSNTTVLRENRGSLELRSTKAQGLPARSSHC